MNRRKTLRLVLTATVLLAIAVSMTASTAVVDVTAGPFEIWSFSVQGLLYGLGVCEISTSQDSAR